MARGLVRESKTLRTVHGENAGGWLQYGAYSLAL